MLKEQMDLLSRLTRPGAVITDASGLPISPRTKTEINCFASALKVCQRMREKESDKWLPMLSKPYRELKKQLEMYCSEAFLEDFLAEVAEKLETNEYKIQEENDHE